MENDKIRTGDAGFINLLITQALGALNDNAFKIYIILMAASLLPLDKTARIIAAASFAFIFPFIIFSGFAGTLADRFSKRKLIIALKAAELVLMFAGFIALYYKNIPFMLGALFFMGIHSALFGPVKLAIIPELLQDRELSHGNGLMSMMSFFGIILGTAAAGVLISVVNGSFYLGAVFFILVSALGLGTSLFVPETGAAGSQEKFELNVVSKIRADMRELRGHVTVYRSLMAGAYFWFVGAMFQMNILIYGKELMKAPDLTLSVFQMIVAAGIGLGSFMAGRLSKDKVELGLVPLGAFGLVLFSLALAFSFGSAFKTSALLFGLGFSGGIFILPLTAFVQHRSPKEKRGKFIAVGNVMAFTGVIIASGFLWLTSGYFKLNPAEIFLVLAVMTLVVAVHIMTVLPEFLIRLCVYPVANIVYRIKTLGWENVPADGGALLVSNHISFVDALLLIGASQRPVRFIIHRKYYKMPVMKWFFKMAGCVPVSRSGGPHAIADSLDKARRALIDGALVCIFIEGEISRHGQMLRFRRGYERIVEGLAAPIIPVHLDGVWGRLFSFEGGRALFKWPRNLGYPVTVSFGAPLPSDTPASRIRFAMQELSSRSFQNRLSQKQPLPLTFAQEAKRHWFRFALADSGGKKMSLGMAFTASVLLSRVLEKLLGRAENVGIVIPPSAGGCLANIAVSLLGKAPVNLNYTNPLETILACAKKAGIEKMIVSKKLAEKMGWPVSENMLFIEDVAAGISRIDALAAALTLFFTPLFALKRSILRKADAPLDATATIIFTSGSTGDPKGVMLSHSNIHANIEALAQIYQMTPSDRLLGVLPFFHSFGYTVTLWLPLIVGFGVVYHYNPLDAATVGRLARKHRATMLLGTPGFLVSYIRRVEPRQFKSLRLVVVGAEKLREEIAAAFLEKFGVQALEGYGCTELSPVASLNTPDVDVDGVRQAGAKRGTIGRPLPGIAMKVVNPETFEPLGADTPGLLLVKGPNVMKGYFNDEGKTAEVMRDGYYVTGDIAAIDDDGFVTITDRLSRFSKIAGEMVPHIKIEEKLHQLAGVIDRTFAVTSVPDAKRGEKIVVLHTYAENMDELYGRLGNCGLPNLWVPEKKDFRRIEGLPMLGTGKLDMAGLKKLAEMEAAGAPAGGETWMKKTEVK
ncbi:MAG: MFS transporter [Elusimicrobia bacterium]|nr:MFS transporter [Elusimicrobiota bacterium]